MHPDRLHEPAPGRLRVQAERINVAGPGVPAWFDPRDVADPWTVTLTRDFGGRHEELFFVRPGLWVRRSLWEGDWTQEDGKVVKGLEETGRLDDAGAWEWFRRFNIDPPDHLRDVERSWNLLAAAEDRKAPDGRPAQEPPDGRAAGRPAEHEDRAGDWPPSAGYALRGNVLGYNGRCYDLRLTRLQQLLLQFLVDARGEWRTTEALMNHVWGGQSVGQDTPRQLAGELRKLLKKMLELDHDPIPCKRNRDWKATLWRLDLR